MSDWLVPFGVFDEGVKASGRAHVGLRHGTMRVLLFAPAGADTQTPHAQDEVYIVRSGSGEFRLEDERRAFGVGDVIFVPAGKDHQFERFSDDFSAWVVFWGPEGGEAA